jgi:uncharacterized protein with GYD domain
MMATYVLLGNYTEQGIKNIKDVPKRRAAARKMGEKLGVEIKAAYLAMGKHDLVLLVEATSDDAMAKWVLSLAAKGNLRTHTMRVFPQEETDQIVAGVV